MSSPKLAPSILYQENFLKDKKLDAHDSFNIIDLGAIKRNYIHLRSKHKERLCSAVVKADAYGLGLEPVSKSLFELGCQDFFVFSFQEGIRLRSILPLASIYVINTKVEDLKYFQKNAKLVPILSDIHQIEMWSLLCRKKEIHQDAIIQFDTGMHRGGLAPKEIDILKSRPELLSYTNVKYIMSHLACAELQNTPMNELQNQRFKKILQFFGKVRATFANSGGIFLGPDYHYDLLRPGAALYGISPTPYKKTNQMEPVMQCYTRIMQIHFVKKSEYVGYGMSYKADKNQKIAIVSAGYSDGYPYGDNNRQRWCYINNQKAPILGQITMNSIVLDVSQLHNVKPGDMVELVGPNIKLEEASDQNGTISRELLHRLGAIYNRLYADSYI